MSGVKYKHTVIGMLPEQTDKWESSSTLVYKIFKVRRSICGVDTILWPGNKRYNLDNWFKLQEYHDSFGLLDKAFQCLDIADCIAWYRKPDNERFKEAEALSFQIIKDMGRRNKYFRSITSFLLVLEDILTLNYNDVGERMFEELFRYFINITGLTALNGDAYSMLKFKYTDENDETLEKKISSKPGLFVYDPEILCNIRSRRDDKKRSLIAVVEVKGLLERRKRGWDSSFSSGAKRRKEDTDEGNAAGGEEDTAVGEEDTPSKVVQMTDHDEQSDSSEEDENNYTLIQDGYENGTPRGLSTEEEEMVKAFLPQLLGEVVAADSSSLLHLQNIPLRGFSKTNLIEKAAVGIGVLGFKVFVINFICVRRAAIDKPSKADAPPLDFHVIPCIAGLGLDILISEPLNILCRNDRNKLFKVLYALQNLQDSVPCLL